jgi:hypothetical protein
MEEIIEENNRRDDRRDIFSEKVYAGKRTYYFDLNETSNGGKCLVISERKLTDGEYNERYKIMVFEENWFIWEMSEFRGKDLIFRDEIKWKF